MITKLSNVVGRIVTLCLQYENGVIGVSSFSLQLASYLDTCRDEINTYIKDTTIIWPAELVTIVRRVRRTGVKNDILGALEASVVNASIQAIDSLEERGTDVSELRKALKEGLAEKGIDWYEKE